MKYFEDPKKAKASQDETVKPQVKSTFKIEISEEEKNRREREQTTLYHTGG
jgi:hypothetical protein